MSDAELEKTDNQPTEDVAEGQGAADAQQSAKSIPVTDVVALTADLQAANDRVLRAQAELENFRKRSRRELDEQRRYANLSLLGDLLPVLDNLDRAMEAAQQADATSGLLEGVKMVSAQMLAVFEQYGCRPIDAVGIAFDPNLHESIGMEPSADLAAGIVTRVTRVGYQLHDRVVRPPQVLISTGLPAGDPDTTSDVGSDGAPPE